jgi:molybdenum cofactor cytidylyltransferase
MGDSIAAGVQATPSATAWLILPADLPLISPDTLRAIAFAAPCAVTLPVYQGRRGHPVRFGLECAEDLLNLQGNKGAAHIILAQDTIDSVATIELDDAGCVADIDTLDDLARAEVLLASRIG